MTTDGRTLGILIGLITGMTVLGAPRPAAANEPYLDVVFSEIMYHAPHEHADAEFVELTNRGSQTADLTGWYIADGIRYAFPDGTTIAPGQRLVVAKSPAAAQNAYGISGVLGPYSGNLSRSGERIELRDHNDGLVNEVHYDTEPPWPTGGRGDGRSIELINLSKNGNVGRFWRPSSRLGGTPGATNAPSNERPVTVVINEFLARSNVVDWVELYNYGDEPVDLNGFYLTDKMDQPTRAQISPTWSAGTTIIPPKGYWVSTELDWQTFALSADGEAIFLVAPNGITWVDGVEFGPQPMQGVSEGRYPDGGDRWYRFLSPTINAANQAPPDRGVVINEIMYNPADETETDPGSEYLELHNLNPFAVDLTGWAFTRGISYTFPPGTFIAANGFVVIAREPGNVQGSYGIGGVLGPYGGKLSNRTDYLVLEDEFGNIVDEVEYRDRGQWPEEPDGDGPSLERINYDIDGRLPGAWRPSTGNGTPGAPNSVFIADPPATIGDDVQHAPLVPTSVDPVTVTARVDAGNLTMVTLFYKRDTDGPLEWNSVPMYDDGQHNDGIAGDGVFGGIIPPHPNGTIIEFYIRADSTGGVVRFPANAPAKSCLYIVENTTPNSNLNIFRIVITKYNHDQINLNPYSDVRRDCTFIYGRAYYNSEIRRRGGSRDWPKHSYKMHITPGYRFRGNDRWDINFEKNDRTLLRNIMIYQLLNNLDLPGSRSELVHTRWRNSYAGVHTLTQTRRRDFISEHYPDDTRGNLYKGIAPWTTQNGGQNIAWGGQHSWFEKQTNEAENDWSDLDELHQITRPAFPQAQYESEVRRVVDVVNWARTYAVLGVGCLIDQPWHFHNQNYRLYSRPSDGRFVHFLHDFDDAYWATMWGNAGPNATLFADVDRFLNHPPFKREFYHGFWRALNLEDGVYREARARTKIAYYHALIYDDVAADAWSGATWNGRWQQFVNARNQWDNWLNGRNSLLRSYLPTANLAITTNGGQPITTDSAQLVLEGTAPLSAARIEIDGSEEDVQWLTEVQWRRTLTLVNQSNTIVVRTLNDDGDELDQVSISVTYTAGVPNAVDFSADVTSGGPPLTVQFTDESTLPGIIERLWEFGDGAVSTEQHPTHTYLYDGAFTVRLTVVTAEGPVLEQKSNFIQVGGTAVEIVNPSFEDPNHFLTGWSSCLAGASSIKHNPGTHPATPRFHDGENSMGMSSDRPGNDLGAGAIWQEVQVVPGRTYRVRFYGYLTASNNDWVDDFFELRVRDGNASVLNCSGNGDQIVNNSTLLHHQPGQASAAWNLLQGDFTSTQSTMTIIAYWKFAGTNWAIHSLHIDDWGVQDLTPGEEADVPAPAMAITEYMYSGSGINGGEFIEFTNLGTTPVSMVGWSFDDDHRVPGTVDLSDFGIVHPGESAILTEDPAESFRSDWGLDPGVKIIGNLGNPIGNNIGRNDELNLYDHNNELVDRLTYGDQNFPGSIRTQRVSGWVQPHGLMANDPYAWVLSQIGDAQNSWQSSNADIGNPGVHVLLRPGDLDDDGDVDHEDFALFQACVTGPSVLYDPQNLPPGCTLVPDAEGILPADFDRDGDVDQDDFAVLQRCFSGEGIPSDPLCAD